MTAIDTTFDRVFEELRADRNRVFEELRAERAERRTEWAEFRAEMGVWRAELRADIADLRADVAAVNDRLSQLGFRAAGILAAGLIALVATQL
jgi:hypothetical protein